MRQFTDYEFNLILEMLDGKGHAGHEFVKKYEKLKGKKPESEKTKLSMIMNKMKKDKLLLRGQRKLLEPGTEIKSTRYEYPFFLRFDIDLFESIIYHISNRLKECIAEKERYSSYIEKLGIKELDKRTLEERRNLIFYTTKVEYYKAFEKNLKEIFNNIIYSYYTRRVIRKESLPRVCAIISTNLGTAEALLFAKEMVSRGVANNDEYEFFMEMLNEKSKES